MAQDTEVIIHATGYSSTNAPQTTTNNTSAYSTVNGTHTPPQVLIGSGGGDVVFWPHGSTQYSLTLTFVGSGLSLPTGALVRYIEPVLTSNQLLSGSGASDSRNQLYLFTSNADNNRRFEPISVSIVPGSYSTYPTGQAGLVYAFSQLYDGSNSASASSKIKQADIDNMSFILTSAAWATNSAEMRAYDFYVIVGYNQMPVATPSITGLSGGLISSTSPTITWTYSDPENNTQARYRIKIFKQTDATAGGFDARLSHAAVFDSGTITGAATSYTVPTGYLSKYITYRLFVFVDDGMGGTTSFSWFSDTSGVQDSGHANIIANDGAGGANHSLDFLSSTDPINTPSLYIPSSPINAATGALSPIVVKARPNLLTQEDASFDTSVGNWTALDSVTHSYTLSRTTANYFRGPGCLAIAMNDSSLAGAKSGPFPVASFLSNPGAILTAAAKVRAPSSCLFTVGIRWYSDAAGTSVLDAGYGIAHGLNTETSSMLQYASDTSSGDPLNLSMATNPVYTTGWVMARVPTGAVSGRLVVRVAAPSYTNVFIDCPWVAYHTPNVMDDPSFEYPGDVFWNATTTTNSILSTVDIPTEATGSGTDLAKTFGSNVSIQPTSLYGCSGTNAYVSSDVQTTNPSQTIRLATLKDTAFGGEPPEFGVGVSGFWYQPSSTNWEHGSNYADLTNLGVNSQGDPTWRRSVRTTANTSSTLIVDNQSLCKIAKFINGDFELYTGSGAYIGANVSVGDYITSGTAATPSGTGWYTAWIESSSNARRGWAAGGRYNWDHNQGFYSVTSPWTGFGQALQFTGVNWGVMTPGVNFGNGAGLTVTGNFCLEAKFKRANTTSGTYTIAGRFSNGNNAGGAQPLLWIDTAGKLNGGVQNNSGTFQSLTSTATVGTTAHDAALSWDGTTLRLFLDGIVVGTTAMANISPGDGNTRFMIGRDDDSSQATNGGFPFNGIIDEVRLSNVARYTAIYTPATTPFTSDANTLLLFHCDSAEMTYAGLPENNAISDNYDWSNMFRGWSGRTLPTGAGLVTLTGGGVQHTGSNCAQLSVFNATSSSPGATSTLNQIISVNGMSSITVGYWWRGVNAGLCYGVLDFYAKEGTYISSSIMGAGSLTDNLWHQNVPAIYAVPANAAWCDVRFSLGDFVNQALFNPASDGILYIDDVTCTLTGSYSDLPSYLDGGWSGGGFNSTNTNSTQVVGLQRTFAGLPWVTTSWKNVRSAYGTTTNVGVGVPDYTMTYADYEWPSSTLAYNTTLYYRAFWSANRTTGGIYTTSRYTGQYLITESSSPPPLSNWLLIDPLNLSDNIVLNVKRVSIETPETYQSFSPLGRNRKVIIGDVVQGEIINLELLTTDANSHDYLMKNLQKQSTLVLRSPDGNFWYVRATKRNRERVWTGSYTRPFRTYSVTFEEVDQVP